MNDDHLNLKNDREYDFLNSEPSEKNKKVDNSFEAPLEDSGV